MSGNALVADIVIAARSHLLASLGSDEHARRARVELAQALLQSGPTSPDTAAEIEALLAFANDPDVARGKNDHWPRVAQTSLGQMYHALGRLEEARTAFEKAYHWRPNFIEYARALEEVLIEMGRPAEAQDMMREHAELVALKMENLPQWVVPERDESPQALYLDLLEKSVTNWIYGDASHPSYGATEFTPTRREVGRDQPMVAHTMIGLKRLHQFRHAIETVIREGVSGNILEAGAWRGGACIVARGVLAVHGVTDRKVFVADSFEGLPPPDARFSKDLATLHHFDGRPELAVGLDQVRAHFKAYDLLDKQVVFVPGWFVDTLPRLESGPLAVLRMDGDLYSSTIDTLDALYDRVSPGGFVICDDYGVVIDAQRAVLDFRRRHNIDAPMFSIDGDGIFWRK